MCSEKVGKLYQVANLLIPIFQVHAFITFLLYAKRLSTEKNYDVSYSLKLQLCELFQKHLEQHNTCYANQK